MGDPVSVQLNSLSIPRELPQELLGNAIRSARAERGYSVRGLARAVGCSASMVSQVERGMSAPSAGMLYAIANELDVSIDSLLDGNPEPASRRGAPESAESAGPREERPSGVVSSPRDRLRSLPPSPQAQVQRVEGRQAINFDNGVRWERLTTATDPDVDFLEIVYVPGSTSSDDHEQVGHEGHEYGLVVEGSLTAKVGAEEFVLRTGDSINFDSSIPHQYRNDGVAPARAIWFVRHR